MQYGIEIVPFGEYANPRFVVELAQAADEAGWEAISLWDHMLMPYGVGDPWVTLSAVAAGTNKLKLLTSVSALPRYRPEALARALVSLDLLSQGRVILGAGIGAIDEEFTSFNLPGSKSERAAMLEEGLQVLTGLWSGEPLEFHGSYYQVNGAALQPTPVQKPRPPVWIGGESRAALRRAARWDGWTIGAVDENSNVVRPPEQMRRDIAYIAGHRPSMAGFAVAVDGVTKPGPSKLVREYEEAGCTWWFELLFGLRGSHAEMLARVKAGPPT